MKSGLFLSALVAATFPLTLPAQQAPNGYHTVTCIKLKPGKTFADYRHWAAEGPHKLIDRPTPLPLSAAAYHEISFPCPGGGIGRRTSFRCWRSQGRGGSSPLPGTILRSRRERWMSSVASA